MYKLLLNGANVYEGGSLVNLIQIASSAIIGDRLEVWEKGKSRQAQWKRLDYGVWRNG